MDSLQERLEDAAQTPANPPYRLATLIQVMIAILTEVHLALQRHPQSMQPPRGQGGSHGCMCT